MPTIYKRADFYVDDQFIGLHEECGITISGNGEQLIFAEGVEESTGTVTTEASVKRVVAHDGPGAAEVDLTDHVIRQTKVTMSFGTNGQVYNVTGKFIRDQMTSTVKSGTVKGDTSFRGGAPVPVPLVF